MLSQIIIFSVCLLFSFFCTAGLIKLLNKHQMLDKPNERSNHKIPVPRGGGIAVFLTIFLGLIYVYYKLHMEMFGLDPNMPIFIFEQYIILGSFILLAAISWLDDIKPLPAAIRFLAQIIAIGLCVAFIFGNDGIDISLPFLPDIVTKFAFGFIWLWFINLYNFMDGIDGITGVETLSITIGIILISLLTSLGSYHTDTAIVIAAATLGFLVWNWHPAKIFMGDVGSIPLGFILGLTLFDLASNGYWAAALILPLYYLADSTYTITKRLFAGKKIWHAHSEHFYQQAVRAGKSHSSVVLSVSICNIMLIVIACYVSINKDLQVYGVMFAVIITALFLNYLKPKKDEEVK